MKTVLTCSRCGSENARRSRSHGVADAVVIAVLPVAPFRCRDCWARFWLLERSWLAMTRAAALVIVALIVIVIVVRI